MLLEINFSMYNPKAVIALTGKTVWLHCLPARAAFRAREPGQSCDQTQRLVKRQKELEIFMNNTVRLSSGQSGRPFQYYSSTLFSYLLELGFYRIKKRKRKDSTIRGRLSENINTFLAQPVKRTENKK